MALVWSRLPAALGDRAGPWLIPATTTAGGALVGALAGARGAPPLFGVGAYIAAARREGRFPPARARLPLAVERILAKRHR